MVNETESNVLDGAEIRYYCLRLDGTAQRSEAPIAGVQQAPVFHVTTPYGVDVYTEEREESGTGVARTKIQFESGALILKDEKGKLIGAYSASYWMHVQPNTGEIV